MAASVDDGDRKSVGTTASGRRSISADRRCSYLAQAIRSVMRSLSTSTLTSASASSGAGGAGATGEPAGLAAFLSSAEFNRVATEFSDGTSRVLYACEAAGGGMFATTDGRTLVYAVGAAFRRWKVAASAGRSRAAGGSAEGGVEAPPARCAYVYKLHAGPLTEEDVEVEVVVGSLASAQAIDAAEHGLRAGPASGAAQRNRGRSAPTHAMAQHPLALALSGAREQSEGDDSRGSPSPAGAPPTSPWGIGSDRSATSDGSSLAGGPPPAQQGSRVARQAWEAAAAKGGGMAGVAALQQLRQLTNRVYLPLLRNSKNRSTWSAALGGQVVKQAETAAQALDTALGRTQGREPLTMPGSPEVLLDLVQAHEDSRRDNGAEDGSVASGVDYMGGDGPSSVDSRGGSSRGGWISSVRGAAAAGPTSSSQVPVLPPIHSLSQAGSGDVQPGGIGDTTASRRVASASAPATAGASGKAVGSASKSRRRQIVHVLEQVVLSWTRAIHRVLRREPEGEDVPEGAPMLDAGLPPCCDRRRHPGPSFELDFWAGQVVRLDAIVQYLATPRARRVLLVLARARSAYEASFGRLCAELLGARDSARRISALLEPLRPWTEKLEQSSDTETAAQLLRPVIHLVQLAWKHGEGTYRRPLRVVVLFRQISNAIIRVCTRATRGMRLLDDEESTHAYEAMEKLLGLCAHFRSVYYDYKARSVFEVPDAPWRFQASALFARLDAMAQRSRELREVAGTVSQFSPVKQMSTGGARGRVLGASLATIYADFRQALSGLQSLPYDPMDIDMDDAWRVSLQAFRSSVSDLGRRLGSVLRLALASSSGLQAQIRAVNLFAPMLHREEVLKEAREPLKRLIEAVHEEVRGTSAELRIGLANGHVPARDAPPTAADSRRDGGIASSAAGETPRDDGAAAMESGGGAQATKERFAVVIAANMPPTAGRISWSRTLQQRIDSLVLPLKGLIPATLHQDEMQGVMADHAALSKQLAKLQQDTARAWALSLEESVQEQLEKPLLVWRPLGGGGAPGTAELPPDGLLGRALATAIDVPGMPGSDASGGGGPFGGPALDAVEDRLHVNLHAGLAALLRESRYLLQLGLDIPRTAAGVYRRDQYVRMYQARLQLLSDTANRIRHETPDVVAPLLEQSVSAFEATLRPGLAQLTWNSPGVDGFLADAEAAAKHVEDRQRVLVNGLGRIAAIVSEWHSKPFFPFDEDGQLEIELGRASRAGSPEGEEAGMDAGSSDQSFPSTFQQVDAGLRQLWQQRLQEIADGGRVIQRTLTALPKELKLARAPPAWHDFCSFVDTLVFSGVVRAIVKHLGDLQRLLLGVTADRDVEGAVATAAAQVSAAKESADGGSGSSWGQTDTQEQWSQHQRAQSPPMIRIMLRHAQDRYEAVSAAVAQSLLQSAGVDPASMPKDRSIRSQFLEDAQRRLRESKAKKQDEAESAAEVVALSFARYVPALGFDQALRSLQGRRRQTHESDESTGLGAVSDLASKLAVMQGKQSGDLPIESHGEDRSSGGDAALPATLEEYVGGWLDHVMRISTVVPHITDPMTPRRQGITGTFGRDVRSSPEVFAAQAAVQRARVALTRRLEDLRRSCLAFAGCWSVPPGEYASSVVRLGFVPAAPILETDGQPEASKSSQRRTKLGRSRKSKSVRFGAGVASPAPGKGGSSSPVRAGIAQESRPSTPVDGIDRLLPMPLKTKHSGNDAVVVFAVRLREGSGIRQQLGLLDSSAVALPGSQRASSSLESRPRSLEEELRRMRSDVQQTVDTAAERAVASHFEATGRGGVLRSGVASLLPGAVAFHSLRSIARSHLEQRVAVLEGLDFLLATEMPAEHLADAGGQIAVAADGSSWLPAQSLASRLLGKATAEDAVQKMQAIYRTFDFVAGNLLLEPDMAGFEEEFGRIEKQLKAVKEMAANVGVGVLYVELGELRYCIVEKLTQYRAVLLAVGYAYVLRRLLWFEAFSASVDASFKTQGWSLLAAGDGQGGGLDGSVNAEGDEEEADLGVARDTQAEQSVPDAGGASSDEFESLGWSQPAIQPDNAELGMLVSHGIVLERVGATVAEHVASSQGALSQEGAASNPGAMSSAVFVYETQRHRTALVRVLASVRDIRLLAAPVQRACQSLVQFSQLLSRHGAADWFELESVELPMTPSLIPTIAAMARGALDAEAAAGIALEDGDGSDEESPLQQDEETGISEAESPPFGLLAGVTGQQRLLELVGHEPVRAPIADLLNDLGSKWTVITEAGVSVAKRLQTRSQQLLGSLRAEIMAFRETVARFKVRLDREMPHSLGPALVAAMRERGSEDAEAELDSGGDLSGALSLSGSASGGGIDDIIGVAGASFETADSVGIEQLLAPSAVSLAADWAYAKLIALNEDLRHMLDEAKDLSSKKTLFDAILQEKQDAESQKAPEPAASGVPSALISSAELASIGAEPLHDCMLQLKGIKLCWDAIVSLAFQYAAWADQPFELFDFGSGMLSLKQTTRQLRQLSSAAKRWPVKQSADKMISLMQKSLPICSDLKGKAIKQRHWTYLVYRAYGALPQLAAVDFRLSSDGVLSDIVCAALSESSDAAARPAGPSGIGEWGGSRIGGGSIALSHSAGAHASFAGELPQDLQAARTYGVLADQTMRKNLRLGDVLQLRVHAFTSQALGIVDGAKKEIRIEQRLSAIEAFWSSAPLKLISVSMDELGSIATGGGAKEPSAPGDGETKEGDREAGTADAVWILVGSESVREKAEDDLSELGAMQAYKAHAAPFKGSIESMFEQLAAIGSVVEVWVRVQQLWASMAGVFSPPSQAEEQVSTVADALPEAAQEFTVVDSEYKSFVLECSADPVAVRCCAGQGRLDRLETLLATLEECQAALRAYLEERRAESPRLCFLPDSQLLKLLACGHALPLASEFARWCFPGLGKLLVEERKEDGDRPSGSEPGVVTHRISGMQSADGEILRFEGAEDAALRTGSPLEVWLAASELRMRRGLVDATETAMEKAHPWAEAGEHSLRADWVLSHGAQSVLTASHAAWTNSVETALASTEQGSPKPLHDCIDATKLGLQSLVDAVRAEGMSRPNRKKMALQITLDVHWLEVTEAILQAVQGVGHGRASSGDSAPPDTLGDPAQALGKLALQSGSDSQAAASTTMWQWQSQLRMYPDVGSSSLVAPSGAPGGGAAAGSASVDLTGCQSSFTAQLAGLSMGLGCEYYGACPRLVVTPLTDRAYLTFSQAVLLGLGSAPAGPAGTGKTETVKDLGRTLMLPVVVTNCGPQTTADNVASVLRTVASNGGWACFDEFNRINSSVLSSVAEVLRTMQAVLRQVLAPPPPEHPISGIGAGQTQAAAGPHTVRHLSYGGAPKARFGVIESRIQPTTSAFITMNPGYAGRVDLPQNVASLFRPCAMVRPDLEAIAANLLLSLGFSEAQPLAKRLVRLVQLAERSLVPRRRYDWGLRALKGCLTYAAQLRGAATGMDAESHAIVQSVRATYSPRLDSGSGDLHVFERLIVELFPSGTGGSPASAPLYSPLGTMPSPTGRPFSGSSLDFVQEAARQLALQTPASFVNAVNRLRQLLSIRHANIILGEPSSGKTAAWRLAVAAAGLQQAETASVATAVEHLHTMAATVLPKSMVGDSLYGRLDASGDWTDGQLTASVRSQAIGLAGTSLPPGAWSRLLVLDGTVDADWIEDLNSVMDDTKTLVLPSRERLELHPAQRILIETSSLRNATPATVSRCGIVFLPTAAVSWADTVRSFCQQLERSWVAVGAPVRLARALADWSEATVVVLVEHVFEKQPRLELFEFSATGAASADGKKRVLVQRVLAVFSAAMADSLTGAKLAASASSEQDEREAGGKGARSGEEGGSSSPGGNGSASVEADVMLAELQGQVTNWAVYAVLWGLGGAIGSGYPATGGTSASSASGGGETSAGGAASGAAADPGTDSMFGDLGDELAFSRIVINAGNFFAAQATRRGGDAPAGPHVDALGESIQNLTECMQEAVQSHDAGGAASASGSTSSEMKELSSLLAYLPVSDPYATFPEAKRTSSGGADSNQYVPSPAAGTVWVPAADVAVAAAHWRVLSGHEDVSGVEMYQVYQAVASACLKRRRTGGKYERLHLAESFPPLTAPSVAGGQVSFLPFPTRAPRLRVSQLLASRGFPVLVAGGSNCGVSAFAIAVGSSIVNSDLAHASAAGGDSALPSADMSLASRTDRSRLGGRSVGSTSGSSRLQDVVFRILSRGGGHHDRAGADQSSRSRGGFPSSTRSRSYESKASDGVPENDWSWTAPLLGYGASSSHLSNPLGSTDGALKRSVESDSEAFSSVVRAIINGSTDVWGSPGDRQDVCWQHLVPIHAQTGTLALQASLESLLGRGASTGLSPATAASVVSSRYFSYPDSAEDSAGKGPAGSKPKSGGGLKQAAGGRGLVILDDIHLPVADGYGTQSHAELLRSLFCFGGWAQWTDSGVSFKRVSGLSAIATCSTSAPGFSSYAPVAPRLLPRFVVIGLTSPTKAAVETVLTSRILGHLRSWPAAYSFAANTAQRVARATVYVFGTHQSLFKASQVFPQTQAGLSDMLRVVAGLCRVAAGAHDTIIKRVSSSTALSPDHPVAMQQVLVPASAAAGGPGSGQDRSLDQGDASGLDGPQLGSSLLPSLWVHEISRELSDRMASKAQMARMSTLVKSIAEREFGATIGATAASQGPEGAVEPDARYGDDEDATEGKRDEVDGLYFAAVDEFQLKAARSGGRTGSNTGVGAAAGEPSKKVYACIGTATESTLLLRNAPTRPSLEDGTGRRDLANVLRQTVLFRNAVKHVLRVLRVIEDEQGSLEDFDLEPRIGPCRRLLLVGPSGCGKRSAVRMASLVAGIKMIDPDDATSFKSKDGADADIGGSQADSPEQSVSAAFRAAWMHAGLVPSRPCVLRLSLPSVGAQSDDMPSSIVRALECLRDSADPWSFSGSFLRQEDVDSILQSPALLADARAMGLLGTGPKTGGKAIAQEVVLQRLFMQRLRSNLRIVVCCSPLNASLSAFARRCPALLTKFTIDWVRPWPKEALADYAEAVLASNLDLPHGLRDAVAPVQSLLSGLSTSRRERNPARNSSGPADAEESKTAEDHAAPAPQIESGYSSAPVARLPPPPASMAALANSQQGRKLASLLAGTYAAASNRAIERSTKGAHDGASSSSFYVHITPRAFLEASWHLRQYLTLARKNITTTAGKLKRGLAALYDGQEYVKGLRTQLEGVQVKLEQRYAATYLLLEQMAREREEARQQEDESRDVRLAASDAASRAMDLEAEAKEALAAASPALEAARYAVGGLSKSSVDELRGMRAPPAIVHLVLQSVLILVSGETRPSRLGWDAAQKSMLKSDEFLGRLDEVDPRHIPPARLRALRPILQRPDFDSEAIRPRSFAAGNLAAFIIGSVRYHDKYQECLPLMQSVDAANAARYAAEDELHRATAKLRSVQERLAALQARFAEATKEKQVIEAKTMDLQRRLHVAEQLLEGMSREKGRWEEDLTTSSRRMGRTAGDSLLAAAFVAFGCGAEPAEREQLWGEWQGLLRSQDVEFTPGLDPSGMLLSVVQGDRSAQEALTAALTSEGLPAGSAALASALAVGSSVSALRVPLVVDPSLQCMSWLLRCAGVTSTETEYGGEGGGDEAEKALAALRGGSDSATALRMRAMEAFGVDQDHGAVLRFVWEAIASSPSSGSAGSGRAVTGATRGLPKYAPEPDWMALGPWWEDPDGLCGSGAQLDLDRPEHEWAPALRKQAALGGSVVALTKKSQLPASLKELLEGNSLLQREHSGDRTGTPDLAEYEASARAAERQADGAALGLTAADYIGLGALEGASGGESALLHADRSVSAPNSDQMHLTDCAVRIGSSQVPLHPKFRLVLLFNPDSAQAAAVTADTQSLVSVVSWPSTPDSIRQDLTQLLVREFEPHVGKQLSDIRIAGAQRQMRLAQIERSLLQRLAAFGGPPEDHAFAHGSDDLGHGRRDSGDEQSSQAGPRTILDDTELLDALNGMRTELQSIHKAREEAEIVGKQLNRYTYLYAPISNEFVRLWQLAYGAQELHGLYGMSLNTMRRVFFATVLDEAYRDPNPGAVAEADSRYSGPAAGAEGSPETAPRVVSSGIRRTAMQTLRLQLGVRVSLTHWVARGYYQNHASALRAALSLQVIQDDDFLGAGESRRARAMLGLSSHGAELQQQEAARESYRASTSMGSPGSGAAASATTSSMAELAGVGGSIDRSLLPANARELAASLEGAEDALRFLRTRSPGWNSVDGARTGNDEEAVGAGVAAAATSPRWIPLSAWVGAAVLSRSVEPFTGHGTSSGASLLDDMLASPGRFKNWLESEEPELFTMPLDWRELDARPLHKTCAVVALRPDRGRAALAYLSSTVLAQALHPDAGPRTGHSPAVAQVLDGLPPGQQGVVAEAMAASPFYPVLLASMDGADAVLDLVGAAQRLGRALTASVDASRGSADFLSSGLAGVAGASGLQRVSLGIGQQHKANAAISTAARNGTWLVLENIHLSMEWARDSLGRWLQAVAQVADGARGAGLAAAPGPLQLPRAVAERTIAEASVVSPSFRLFLSAEAIVEGSPRSRSERIGVPVSIVSQSSLLAYERPSGSLPGVVESVSAVPDSIWQQTDVIGRSVMLRVCLMHAALSQRGRFGLNGWLGGSKYAFAATDVAHASRILPEVAERVQSASSSGDPESAAAINAWLPVQQLLSEALYGGRVSHEWDRRLIRVLSQKWLPAGLSTRRGLNLLPLATGDGGAGHLEAVAGPSTASSVSGATLELTSPELQPRREDYEAAGDHPFGVSYLVHWARQQDVLQRDAAAFYGVSTVAASTADSSSAGYVLAAVASMLPSALSGGADSAGGKYGDDEEPGLELAFGEGSSTFGDGGSGGEGTDDGTGGAMSDGGSQQVLLGARSIAQDIVDEWKGVSLDFMGDEPPMGGPASSREPQSPGGGMSASMQLLSKPFAVAFAFEARGATAIVRCIVEQVMELLSGIRGTAVLTAEMKSLAGSLAGRTVPPVWQELLSAAPYDDDAARAVVQAYSGGTGSGGSGPSLSGWLQNLALSWRQLYEWMDDFGGPIGGVPPVLWAGGLLRPELLLTAVQRQAVMYLGCSLEQVSVESRMLSSSADDYYEPPARGLIVSGLLCRGCCWSTAKAEGSVHHGSLASADGAFALQSAGGGSRREGKEGGDEAYEYVGPVNGGVVMPLLHLTGVSGTGLGGGYAGQGHGIFAPLPLVRVDPAAGKAVVLATLSLPVASDPVKLALAGAVIVVS